MNVAYMTEQALQAIIRQYAQIGTAEVRTFQRPEITNGGFPRVDVRAAPPSTQDNGVTFVCRWRVLLAAKVADDPQTLDFSAAYESLQDVADRLARDDATVKAAFEAELAAKQDQSATLHYGGTILRDAPMPSEDETGELFLIEIVGETYYSRSDFT